MKFTTQKFAIYYLIILTLFSLGLRLYRFAEPNHYYFDEVYHAVTAKAYADNNPAPYDPFSPAPKEGTAYDWLHPPLAKLIQAGSIKLFGDGPVGWRLPSVIFGTAIIPATFLLAFILFGPLAAVFAATVIAFENLTFVMSRITMNDVFITFFTLMAFTFTALYVKRKNRFDIFWISIFLGLAFSSKWTGLYTTAAVFIFVLIIDYIRKNISLKILMLILIPPLIYLASYGQFWLQGHTIGQFVDLHKQIWWYQNRHDLQHSYGTTALYCVPKGLNAPEPKEWCPWILNMRGVYFSYEQYGDGKAGYIYALGNPLIFWAGVVAITYMLGKFLEDKNKGSLLIMFGYFVFWVPWIFTPRILFFYHYLPAIPFLAIALGYSLKDMYKSRLKYLSYVILFIFIAVFFYFYPISSGFPIKIEDIDKYMWIKSWR